MTENTEEMTLAERIDEITRDWPDVPCPHCGSYYVYAVNIDDERAEYRCGDCGEYFVDDYP